MSIEDGGPAFPGYHGLAKWDANTNSAVPVIEGGMSLLDWFAGKAMAALLSNPTAIELLLDQKSEDPYKEISEAALRQAESMLRARSK